MRYSSCTRFLRTVSNLHQGGWLIAYRHPPLLHLLSEIGRLGSYPRLAHNLIASPAADVFEMDLGTIMCVSHPFSCKGFYWSMTSSSILAWMCEWHPSTSSARPCGLHNKLNLAITEGEVYVDFGEASTRFPPLAADTNYSSDSVSDCLRD